MKSWFVIAIGCGVCAAEMGALAPATLIDYGISQATHGRIRIAEAQGTVWAGSGQLEIRDVTGRNAIGKDLAWKVLAESFWRGRLLVEVQLDRSPRRFVISASPARLEITDAEIRLPATALAFAEPRLKPLKLSGEVRLASKSVVFGNAGMEGDAALVWEAAGSDFSPVSPIGSYELKMTGHDKAVAANLRTLQGPLQLDGSGGWSKDRALEFNAVLQIPSQYREQLTPLMRLISVQRDEGSFELQLK